MSLSPTSLCSARVHVGGATRLWAREHSLTAGSGLWGLWSWSTREAVLNPASTSQGRECHFSGEGAGLRAAASSWQEAAEIPTPQYRRSSLGGAAREMTPGHRAVSNDVAEMKVTVNRDVRTFSPRPKRKKREKTMVQQTFCFLLFRVMLTQPARGGELIQGELSVEKRRLDSW